MSAVTTKDVTINTKNEQRHYLIGKCPDDRPASFEIRYAERWIKEDGRHLHRILRNYNLDPMPSEYEDRKKMQLALNSIRAKSKSLLNLKSRGIGLRTNLEDELTPDPDFEDFTIDQGDKDLRNVDQKRCILDYVYKNLGAKYVKILKNQEPIKLVWGNRPFCSFEKVSPGTLNKLRREGIDFNKLKNTDLARYYNSLTRCYAPATTEYEGKKLCRNHYQDVKFGRDISEDFNDGS